jgi:hypothetical protein
LKTSNIMSKVFARGAIGPEFWPRIHKIMNKISAKLGPSLLPPTVSLSLSASSCYGKQFKAFIESKMIILIDILASDVKSLNRSLGICSNTSDILDTLNYVLKRSKDMYDVRAYLHWYERYAKNDTSGMFEEAFESIEAIQKSYNDFSQTLNNTV